MNRSSVTSGFAALSPPWVLTTLDGYFNAINSTLNDSSLGFVNTGTDTGSSNNYMVPTLAFGTFSGYNQGSTFVLVPANSNTGASTLTLGILGSAPIVDANGNALIIGALVAGRSYPLLYTGTSFRMLTPPIATQLISSMTTTTYSLACDGVSTASFRGAWLGAGGFATTVSLAHLSPGVPVTILVTNSSSGASNLVFAATDTSGSAYPLAILGVGFTGLQTAVTVAPGKFLVASLMSANALLIGSFLVA